MITGFLLYILVLVPSVFPKASSCGVLHVVAAKILAGSNGNDLNLISHAFVQMENELHYFRDVSSQEVAFVNKNPEFGFSNDYDLHFEPKELDFEPSFLGQPRRVAITVQNPNEVPVIIHAITSKTMDFYFSFPEDKIIKPGLRSKFIITFLPRKEGISTTMLSIHTSIGIFLYKVLAHAHGNPYRIQATTKARLPINGTFEFPVFLHNPHPEKLRLVNAFSSHAELVLMHKRSSIQIDIAPFETVNIGNAVIAGATERNITVFLMLKVDLLSYNGQPKMKDIQLVMAVDLDVTSKRGIFSTADLLDFGLIKYGERSKRLVFKAYSTVEKGLEIDSVYVDKSNVQNNGIYMQFATKPPISVKCKSKSQPGAPVSIANIEIDTSFLSLNQSQKIHHVNGEIVAESRGGNYNATIRFQAVIFIGDILHTSKDAAFHRGIKPPSKQSVSLQNNYPFGLAIWNVSIAQEAQKYFKASLIRPVVEIAANKTNPAILVEYIKKARENFTTTCTLSTNVTTFEFSLFIFAGEISITVHSLGPRANPFDFGPIKPGTRRSIFFTVSNPNPIIMKLRNLNHPILNYAIIEPIKMLTIEKEDSNDFESRTGVEWIHGSDFPMPANSFIVFNFSLIVPEYAKTIKQLHLNISTDYKQYDFPIKYELSNSTITFVDRILDLGESFPGKISSKNIRVYSLFDEDLRVLGLSVLDKDPRFFFKLKPKSELVIKSKSITSLGQLRFSQSLSCTSNCYAGFPLHTADGQWFNYGLKLPQNLAEIDSYLYSRLRRRFNAIEKKKVRATVLVDTEKAKSFDAHVETELTWPRLFSHPVVHFPLTSVGNFSILNLTLSNPSIHPVIVQLLPLVIYPDAEALLDFFREEFSFPISAPVEMNETLMFSLRDTELFTLKAGSPVPKLREQLEKVVGGPVPRFTLSMILQPGMSIRVRIGFLPTDYTLRSSLLLIRNNLTAIEPVVLYGKGAHINMEIDGKPARGDYLLFDILPVHLTDCHNPKRLTHKLPTTLTVKRSFIVKNRGEVKFTVTNIAISGTPCKDRGFRVLNCKSFTLAPNETHALEIAYTPDFLMSVNEASLQLTHHMNSTPWTYDMVATVAADMLPVCHTALPRPPFEWVMYYSCMFALVFCMICVIACAYLEGDRFITTNIQQQSDTLSEKDEQVAQSKGETSEMQANTDQKPNNFFHRLLYGPRDQHYLYAFEFGTGPLSKLAEKCCNYVIWICANILLVIRGEPVRSSTSKRNKRNRRRIGGTGFNNEAPTQEYAYYHLIGANYNANNQSNVSIHNNSSSAQNKLPVFAGSRKIVRPVIIDRRTPINNFSDSMSSTRSHEDDNKSESSSQGLKKRKNVGKKQSNEIPSEPPIQQIETTKPKPTIKVSAIQKAIEEPAIERVQKDEPIIEEQTNEPIAKEPIIKVENVKEKIQLNGTANELSSNVHLKLPLSLKASTASQIESSDQASIEMSLQNDADEEVESGLQEYEERIDLSDSSALPEWADASIAQGNLNDEFDEMVKQSTALFSPVRATSAMSNSSHSTRLSQSDNIQPSSSVEDSKKRKRRTKKKKTDAPMNPSMKMWLTKKEINRLTTQYKQQLEAMANNMQFSDPMPFIPPPFMLNQAIDPSPSLAYPMSGQFMPLNQPDSYNEFMRLQLQYQRDQELQRQMFGQQTNVPPSTVQHPVQSSPTPWSTGDPPPRPNVAGPSNANSTQSGNNLFAESTLFNPLSSDLFTAIGNGLSTTQEQQPIIASTSFFDSLSQLDLENEDSNNQFLSLYSDDDHWKPILEAESNKQSLWPNLSDDTKKKEE